MKDTDIQHLTTLASVLLEAEWGWAVKQAVEEILQCLDKMHGPVTGRQARKYRACVSELRSGMEKKISSAKKEKREKDAEVVLGGLWNVESMQYRPSGTVHEEKVALALCHRKFRIVWSLNHLSDAKGVTERAWDLFRQLIDTLHGDGSTDWLPPPKSGTVEETTIELVFGVVTLLMNSLAKAKQGGKILALRAAIEGLAQWAIPLDDEKRNDLFSRVESQLAFALTGWGKHDECYLTEGDLAALVTLHARACSRVTHNALRHVMTVIQRIPTQWLGRTGAHVLLNIDGCEQAVVQKVWECFTWQILRKCADQKCNVQAMHFMTSLKGLNLMVPEQGGFHVGAVEMIGLPSTQQFNLKWGSVCQEAVSRLTKSMKKDGGGFKNQEAVSNVVQGLECLGIAGEFLLQNSLDWLKEVDSHGKNLVKAMCDGLRTIWQLMEMKTEQGFASELLDTHRVRLVRALIVSLRVEARSFKDCPKNACTLSEFRRLLAILTQGPDISSDVPSLGWRIVQLGNDLNESNCHREAAHAFLGAGLILSKCLPQTGNESHTFKNVRYCCWNAKDKLVRYGGLDPGAELSFLAEIVVNLIQNSGCSPAAHGHIVSYYAELMVSCSNLVPVQTLTDQALERSTWHCHLRDICRIAWMEIDELGRIRPENCVFVHTSLCQAVKLLESNSSEPKYPSHLARMQVLKAIVSRLTQLFSESEDTVDDDELKKVSDKICELVGQDRSDSLEALGCGYLAFGLMYACHAGNMKSDTEMASLWWNRSLSRLREGADAFLMLLSDLSPDNKVYDPIFVSETLMEALWLTDARGFLTLSSKFRSILARLVDSGRLEYLNERVEKNLAYIADCHWLGHTEDLLGVKTLGKDGKSGSLCAILGDIQRCTVEGSAVDSWLDAYCGMGPELEKYNDAAGFQARIYLHMVACRSDFSKGRCIKALDHILEAIKKANGYHIQTFSSNKVSIGLTTVPWWVKGDYVSAFLMKAEILELMGRPKEAQHWLDNLLEVAESMHAHSYIALANLMKAKIDIRLEMLDQARGAIEKAKLDVEAGKQGSEEKDCVFGYLEALLLKTEGDLVQERGTTITCRSSCEEAVCLYKSALESLDGDDLGGCMLWPSQALRLKIETSLADCHSKIDHMEPALHVLISSFGRLNYIEKVKDYLGTDTLVAVYQACRICRKRSDSTFSGFDDLGHFFGLRSTRDRFWRVVLDSDDEMDAEPTSSVCHGWMLDQAQKIVTTGRLNSALDWIEILVYCWNHFHEIPERMRDVSMDLSAEFGHGGQLHAAVFFLFWAMGSTFRLQCLTNLKNVRLSSKDVHSLLTPPTFSLQFGGISKSDLVVVDEQCREHLENMMSHLPPNTCSIAISQHPWTRNVLVGRYTIGKSPVLVMLPAVCQTLENPVESERLNLVSAVKRVRSLLNEHENSFDGNASETMIRSVQKEWWASRFRSEKYLKELVVDIDTDCLGEWSWLLSGEIESQEIQHSVAELATEFTEGFVRSVPGTTETAVLTELVRLAFMAGDHVSLDGLTRGVEMLCELVGCPDDAMVAAEVSQARKKIWGLNGLVNYPCDLPSVAEETCMLIPDEDPPPTARRRRASRISLMQATKTPVRSANRTSKPPTSAGRPVQTPKSIKPISEENIQATLEKKSRMASMLTLDPSVQALPWENCPSLTDWTFYRAPSLVVACALGMELNQQEVGNDGGMGPAHNIDLQSTFYVLDPDGDLPTLSAFKDQFSEIPNWRGVTGARPCWDDLSRELEARDMYIYFGHGLGERFINSNELKKLSSCSAALIMGCNSGTLWDRGRYEPDGRILNFLLGGCPAAIGNLWTVGDKSINQFSQGVLNSWKSKNVGDVDSVCLASSLSGGRESCQLRYLTGAAAVCYGVPVRMKRFKDRET